MVVFRSYEALRIGLQAIALILGQRVYCIKEFLKYFNCHEIGHYSMKFPTCKLIRYLGSTRVPDQVRALEVCYDYRETDHQSKNGTIEQSLQSDQSIKDVKPSAIGIPPIILVSYTNTQSNFGCVQICTSSERSRPLFGFHRYGLLSVYYLLVYV